MRRRLPALNALRSFEAVARLRSFSAAAAELGVTPAAVSHQVKVLEEQIGQSLLRRSSRVVAPTADGTALATAVGEALDGIVAVLRRFAQRRGGDHRLVVSTSPSLAAKWLVQRLEGFTRGHPAAEVRIDVSSDLAELGGEGGVDLALRFGSGSYRGLVAEQLFSEVVFPVCSPRLLRRGPPLRKPADLRQHTLIHYDWQGEGVVWPDWQSWLAAAGVSGVDTERGLHFTHSTLALQAALDGQGVALGDSTLVADDLRARRLVQPLKLSLQTPRGFAYHLVYPAAALEKPLAREFRAWVLAEAAKTKRQLGRRGAAAANAAEPRPASGA
ncbi:MAG TPA: transcriptional regulator GcvA [Kiloniellales bacterium]|nr:transcriptional regulator GcvA [Kiloniellales bacterium]